MCGGVCLQALELWSVARPFLYVATLRIHLGGLNTTAVDSLDLSFGARNISLDPNHGILLQL